MNLKEEFVGKIIQELKIALKRKSIYQVPIINKLVINVWVWTYLLKAKTVVDDVVDNVSKITGQKPIVINSKLAVSNFKLKKWVPNWVKVTLRWKKMFDFIEKLISVWLPRERDFRWISKKSFDDRWNYNLWIKDVTIFPEVELDDISKTHWVQIVFSLANCDNKEDSQKLLKALWLPFEK